MNKLRLLEVVGTGIGILGILFLAHGMINDSQFGALAGLLCLFGGILLGGGAKLWTYLRK